MSAEAWIGICGLGITVLGAILLQMYRQGRLDERVKTLQVTVAEIKRSVNNLWDFLVQRGKAEFVQRGWGHMTSPILNIDIHGMEAVEPFMAKFLPFYIKLVTNEKYKVLSEAELERLIFQEFQNQFGELFWQEVCIPKNVTTGACIIAAIESCKLTLKLEKHPGDRNAGT